MSPIRIVRLGTLRLPDEELRIGTVRHPPRSVPKELYSSQNWYDVWFPTLAPRAATMKLGLGAETPAEWSKFARAFRREMAAPEAKHAVALLAALSHVTDFSIGCYCEREDRCHRSILRELLIASGASVR